MPDVTQILGAIEDGNAKAADELLPIVYNELRKLAAKKMANEKPGQTLSATSLVHEVYIRLVEAERAQHWASRCRSSTRNQRPGGETGNRSASLIAILRTSSRIV